MKFGIGQPVPRTEDPRLVTGRGRYTDDVRLPGQCFGAVLRSPVASGTITHLDTSSARQTPGVLAVYAGDDVAERLRPIVSEAPMEPRPATVQLPHLADGRVRFVGQPIAFVVAESSAAALDALDAIVLDIDEAPAVTDPDAALAPGAPQVHDDVPDNLSYHWQLGDRAAVDAAFEGAAHVVEAPVLNQRLAVASLEPRAINIRYDAETGRWEAWASCQGAFGMRGKIASALGVEPSRVRVHVPDVGGGFGMKLMAHPEYGLAALAAQDLGRPVAWTGERTESFLSDAQARDMRGRVEGAFDADGRILALRMRIVSGLGAYHSTMGPAVHTQFSAPLLGGMYDVPAIHADVRGAFTNTVPTDAYRGAGRPEVIFATEMLMETAARRIGIDRVELRRRNLLTPDRVPHATPGGMTFDSLDCVAVLDRAVEAADLARFDARAAEAEARGAVRGYGVAYYMERTGGAPVENARLHLGTDGRIRIWVGTQSSGQGHATAWAQVLHDRLGVHPDTVDLMEGDSDALPAGGNTGGSRSLIQASRVLILGADDMIAQAKALAAEHLEAAVADLEFDPGGGGAVRVVGTDRAVGLTEVARMAGGLTATGHVEDRESTFPNGCHVAEAEIDRATGRVTIVRYTVVDDFGRLVNPSLVRGQVHGGIVQGIGQVLSEAQRWSDDGQPLAASFMDYAMPLAEDMPAFDVDFVEVPAKTNPLGVKGCGESGAVGGIPATALAVLDAIERAGGRPVEPPFTPLAVWRALAA